MKVTSKILSGKVLLSISMALIISATLSCKSNDVTPGDNSSEIKGLQCSTTETVKQGNLSLVSQLKASIAGFTVTSED